MKNAIIVIGAGGHARSLVDAVLAQGDFDVIGFVDKDKASSYRGIGVVGHDSDLQIVFDSVAKHAAIGIGHLGGNPGARKRAVEAALDSGFSFPSIVDPTAAIADDAKLERGVFVGKNAVVNSAAYIGEFAIINSGAIVEHDCVVRPGAHVACNATLCGGVLVGANALIGAGAVVIQGIKIGEGAIVGAGSTVLADVPAWSTVYGVHNGGR